MKVHSNLKLKVPLLHKVKHVILFSGTPTFAKPKKLWQQLHAIACGGRTKMNS